MPTVIEIHELVCVDLRTNHNKWYHIELFDNGDVLGRWGRVGYENKSQEKMYPSIGMDGMLRKMKEKHKKGYKEIETIESDMVSSSPKKVAVKGSLQKIAQDQIVSSHPQTQKLIVYLTKVNAHNIHNATGGKIEYDIDEGLLKTARGIITPNAISEARVLLVDIADAVNDKKFDTNSTIDLVEDYLTIVPQNMGMKRFTVRNFLPDLAAVQRQNDLLDSLDASVAAAVKAKPKKKGAKKDKAEPKVFDAKLELIEDSKVMDKIQRLYTKSRSNMHTSARFKIRCVYSVDVASVAEAFDVERKRIGNVMRLWHGTKASNLLSILKSGLIIPPTSSPHVTGRMFGSGIYASDQSTKALNYATSFWGGKDEGRYFMFLLDMAMGKVYTPSSGWGSQYPKRGYDSTFAKARQSGVQNNEMIVYKCSQVNLVYLVEFK